jgi:hypothetical protein
MYSLLINLHLHQLIPVCFMICINLVQLARSNALCQSMKYAHNSSSIYKVRSVIIHSLPITFLDPSLLLSVVTTIFAVYAMRLIVLWSLNFVAFSIFFIAISVTSVKPSGYSQFSYMLSISCVTIPRPSSANIVNTFCRCMYV